MIRSFLPTYGHKPWLVACAVSVIILLFMAGCTQPYPTTDFIGNVYPAKCRYDLSYVDADIITVAPTDSRLRKVHPDQITLGTAYIFKKLIVVSDRVSGWKREEVIHHERCHFIAGDWHGH